MAEAVAIIECDRAARLLQGGIEPRRSIVRLVVKRTQNIDITKRAVGARELRIGLDRTAEIFFRGVESGRGEGPQVPATRCSASRRAMACAHAQGETCWLWDSS